VQQTSPFIITQWTVVLHVIILTTGNPHIQVRSHGRSSTSVRRTVM